MKFSLNKYLIFTLTILFIFFNLKNNILLAEPITVQSYSSSFLEKANNLTFSAPNSEIEDLSSLIYKISKNIAPGDSYEDFCNKITKTYTWSGAVIKNYNMELLVKDYDFMFNNFKALRSAINENPTLFKDPDRLLDTINSILKELQTLRMEQKYENVIIAGLITVISLAIVFAPLFIKFTATATL